MAYSIFEICYSKMHILELFWTMTYFLLFIHNVIKTPSYVDNNSNGPNMTVSLVTSNAYLALTTFISINIHPGPF
jgi:hypothetical protein